MLEILGGMVVLIIMIVLSGLKTVKEHSQLVVFRYGKVVACKGPGLHLILPIIDNVEMIDTRIVELSIPAVVVTTLDGESLEISAQCLYQISDAKRTVTKIEDAKSATDFVTQSALRELARQNSAAFLKDETKRANIRLKSLIEKQTLSWGIRINAVEIVEIRHATGENLLQLEASPAQLTENQATAVAELAL